MIILNKKLKKYNEIQLTKNRYLQLRQARCFFLNTLAWFDKKMNHPKKGNNIIKTIW